MRLLATLIAFIFPFVSRAQDPCITHELKGYRGACDLSVVWSPDGKLLYTADHESLKIWDVATKKVLQEISPFRHQLKEAFHKTGYVQTSEGTYSIAQRKLIKSLNDLSKSPPASFANDYPVTKLMDIEETDGYTIFESRGIVYRTNTKTPTSPVPVFKSQALSFSYDPQSRWAGAETSTGEYIIVDATTGQQLQSHKIYARKAEINTSPGSKYAAIYFDEMVYLLENQSNKIVATVDLRGYYGTNIVKVYWKADNKAVYIIGSSKSANDWISIKFIKEFKIPQFVEVPNQYESKWRNSYVSAKHPYFSEKENVFFLNKTVPYLFKSYSLEGTELVDSISLRYVPTAEDLAKEAEEQQKKQQQLDLAIDAIYKLDQPSTYLTSYNKPTVVDYSYDGNVLLGDDGYYMLWSFPRGTYTAYVPKHLENNTAIGKDAVILPSVVTSAALSASGKYVGFNLNGKLAIYQGNQLKVERAKRLIALFDDRALVADIAGKRPEKYEGLEVIDPESGTTLQTFTESFNVSSIVVLNKTGSVVFYVNPSRNKESIYVYNVKQGFAAITKPQLEQYGHWVENLSNFKHVSFTKYHYGRYILAVHPVQGIYIYDTREAKYINSKPIMYPWVYRHQLMLYFPINQQVLVFNSSAGDYVRAGAEPDEPGASAYSIDLNSGDIKPYLMHIARAKDMKVHGPKWYEYYRGKSDCDLANLNVPAGTLFQNIQDKRDEYVVLGFDCKEMVYVTAYRIHDVKEGVYYVRLKKMNANEVGKGSTQMGNGYNICGACNGSPLGFKESYFTGWSNWEQKNFNIYTRKYVRNQVQKVRTVCGQCKGNGWVKQ